MTALCCYIYLGSNIKTVPNPAQERGNQYFGANVMLTYFQVSDEAGGLLYPSPAANLVGVVERGVGFH